MEHNIRMEYRLPATEENGETLMTAFAQYHPAAGNAGNGNIDVWITVQANDALQAIDLGVTLSRKVDGTLVALEVLPTADFDRREGLTPVPELIGADEAAEILGISRQAVGKKFREGSLPGHRVGERGLAFARRDVEAVAAKRVTAAV